MKNFENDKKNEYQLSIKEKVNDTTMKTSSIGSITYEGDYAFLTYRRTFSSKRDSLEGNYRSKAVVQMDEY